MIATLTIVIALSRAVASYQPARPVAAGAGAKRAVLEYIQAQNERKPGLMAKRMSESFHYFDTEGKDIGNVSRKEMIADLAKASSTPPQRLALEKLVLCGPKRSSESWVVKEPFAEEKCRVKMIPGEARALVKVQGIARTPEGGEMPYAGQFIFYLRREAGTWVVYGSQPG